MFDDQLVIKANPELRHVLAHLAAAIEHVADGQPLAAKEHLASVEGLYLFDRSEDELAALKKQQEKAMAKRDRKCTDRNRRSKATAKKPAAKKPAGKAAKARSTKK